MAKFEFMKIDHVQLAMPVGGEEAARKFYGEILGLTELPKPAPLAARGGAWFAAGEVQLHLGVEADFRPTRKAHPALRVCGYHELLAALRQEGIPVREDFEIPGLLRAHISDPFGNRIELIAG